MSSYATLIVALIVAIAIWPTPNFMAWTALAVGLAVGAGVQQIRVNNAKTELAQVREQHAKAVADAVTKALAQEREDRAKETTNAADTTKNADQFTQGSLSVMPACALVSQAAFDSDMTRGWYVDAARLLRQCGRVMAARSAESKARRARKGVFD